MRYSSAHIANTIIIAIHLHFCLFLFRIGENTLRLKAVLSINLPEKSHEKQPKKERKHINIVKDIDCKALKHNYCKSFKELCNRPKKSNKIKL